MSETCVLFAVNAFWATLLGCAATVSTVVVSQKGSGCRSCVVAPNANDFAFIAENCFMSQCQHRARDELPAGAALATW